MVLTRPDNLKAEQHELLAKLTAACLGMSQLATRVQDFAPLLTDVTCASGSQYSSVWVGLGGYNSSTVEQIGTEADCSNGTPVYYAWYQFYPDQRHTFSEPVHPGDELIAFSAYNAVQKNYNMGILDYTGFWRELPVGAASTPPPSSAEVIVGLPPCDSGCIPPLANFGTVSITEPWSTPPRLATPTRCRSS